MWEAREGESGVEGKERGWEDEAGEWVETRLGREGAMVVAV